jgi:hypothetical protein
MDAVLPQVGQRLVDRGPRMLYRFITNVKMSIVEACVNPGHPGGGQGSAGRRVRGSAAESGQEALIAKAPFRRMVRMMWIVLWIVPKSLQSHK